MTLDPRMETEYREIELIHSTTCALTNGVGTRCSCNPTVHVVNSRAGGSDV